jgi:phospholipid transport system substrate-binding protein
MQSQLISRIVVFGIAIAVTGCTSIKLSGEPMMVDQSNYDRLNGSPATTIGTEYTPTESVKNTITDVLSIIGNEALRQPGRSQERRHHIEQVIRHRVNFGQMAQSSLGTPWTRLSDKERQEFVTLFVELIRDRVANKVDQYYGEQIFYLDEQREGRFAQVRTNMNGPKVDTALDFRLENHSDQWLVYDLVIDGTSIVGNYRAQFSQIIHDNTYARLVEKMKQRVHTVKGFEKTLSAIALLPMDMSESR